MSKDESKYAPAPAAQTDPAPERRDSAPAAQASEREEVSDSELAEAIAQAVAENFSEEPEPAPSAQEPPAPSEPPTPPPETPTPAETPVQEPPAPRTDAPEKALKSRLKQHFHRRAPEEARPIYRPAARKIPKGTPQSGFMQDAAQTLEAIRNHQRQDLPDNSVSLKRTQQRYAAAVRLSGMAAPVRYVVLALSALALLGRRYSWMLLGFLGGQSGILAAEILAMVGMIVSWRCVIRAVRDGALLRASFESLLLLTTILSMAQALIYKDTETLLPLLTAGWCLSGTADLMEMRAKLRSLRALTGGKDRVAVRVRRDLWEHTDCIGKAPASTTGFVRHLEERDTWHGGWSVFGPVLALAALVVGAVLSAQTQRPYLTVVVTLLTVSLPVGAAMCYGRPYELLARALGRKACVAGWYAVKTLSGKRAVLIYDSDLFPAGTITHKGVKVYGSQTPQMLVSYGASLVLRADSGLTTPFTQLLRETGGQVLPVRYFQVTEGGLSGQIDRDVVAVGTYNFMQLLGAIPPQGAPKNGLFIAVNGLVAGLFAIRYRVKGGAAGGFRRLTHEPNLTPLAATKNLCVNPSYMSRWFGVPVGEIICPKINTRWKLSEPAAMARGTTCGFVMTQGVGIYSRMVAGARRLRRMAVALTGLSMGYSVGLLILAAGRIAGGAALPGPERLVLIQVLAAAVVELWSRRVSQ